MRPESMILRAAALLAILIALSARAPGAFAGRLEGVLSEAGVDFPLPQAPAFKTTVSQIPAGAAASEFEEVPVSIPSHDGWILRGMLAVPRGAGPETPAVVLLHMSGAFGMDEDMPETLTHAGRPAKLFKQLSDALARAGFVVLRYDKRGVLGWDAQLGTERVDQAVFGGLTVDDLTKDAATAVRFLRNGPGGSKRRVLLLGQSEGTALAPLVAELEPVDGLILMGAMASRFDELLRHQIVERRIGWALSLDEDKDGFLSRWETARVPRDFMDLRELIDFHDWDANGDGQLSVAEIRTAFETTLENDPQNKTPWYRSHLGLRPTSEVLPEFRGPILILQGDQDANTPVSEARLLERSLGDSRHPDFSVEILPGLGHAFSPPGNGGLPTVGPIAPQALDSVTRWAQRRFLRLR